MVEHHPKGETVKMNKSIEKSTQFVTSRVVKTKNGYGLFIICGADNVKTYPDLSSDLPMLCAFSDKINQGEVSPLHIDEIIEDMLG